MSTILNALTGYTPLLREALSLLIGATVRGGVLLLFAAAVVRLWPRTSAMQRHLVWTVACCGLLVLPGMQLIVPEWGAPVPAVPSQVISWELRTTPEGSHAANPIDASTAASAATIDVPANRTPAMPVWVVLTLGVWLGGALVVFGTLLRGYGQARRYVSAAGPLADARVLSALAAAAHALRLDRRVPVRCHASAMPVVVGILRPAIVLPDDAHAWGDARLRHVLLHELAHVKRYDNLIQAVTSLTCALYWFNPLVWMAARELRTERERACDDCVLLGARCHPADYAMDLLELARAFRPVQEPALAALAFVRASQIQTRLQAIVDDAQRRTRVSPWGTVMVWGVGLGVVGPLAGVTSQPRTVEQRAVSRRHISPGTWLSPTAAQNLWEKGGSRDDGVPISPFCRIDSEPAETAVVSTNPFNHTEHREMMKATCTRSLMAAGALAAASAQAHAHTRAATAARARVMKRLITDSDSVKVSPTPGVQLRREVGRDITVLTTDSIDSIVQIAPVAGVKSQANQRARDPIVVIDGARVSADRSGRLYYGPTPLDEIDPNNIETIEVLKGPSAVATYGPDAKDGVIVITTKSGTKSN